LNGRLLAWGRPFFQRRFGDEKTALGGWPAGESLPRLPGCFGRLVDADQFEPDAESGAAGFRMKKEPRIASAAFVVLLSLTMLAPRCVPPRIGGDGKLSLVGRYNIDMAYGFDIKDQYAYLGTNEGLCILDISDRGAPRRIGELEWGFVKSVTIIDRTAYLCGGENGLLIVDVAEAAHPHILGKCLEDGDIYGFAKSGTYAFVCDRKKGLQVLDIQDPFHPRRIGFWSNGGEYWDIEIKDDVAYVADLRNGLELIDLADPSSPRLIAAIPGTEGAACVQLDGQRLCLGSFHGIKEYDVTQKLEPKLLMSALSGQEVLAGRLSNHLLLAGAGGIIALNVGNPDQPVPLARWTIKGGVHEILTDGEYVYTAKIGFYILRLKGR